MGLASGAEHLHLCDFDRALHWMARFPDEVHAMLADVPLYDFLIMGRSARAWETHPPVQKVTEDLTNLVFAKIYGEEVDIAGGSRGLSRQAARLLSIHSREETVGVDGEWPILLKRFPELKRGYRAYDGLEFETADERQDEIAAAGGQAAWEEKVLDSPEAWLLRIEVTHDTIAAAVRATSAQPHPPRRPPRLSRAAAPIDSKRGVRYILFRQLPLAKLNKETKWLPQVECPVTMFATMEPARMLSFTVTGAIGSSAASRT